MFQVEDTADLELGKVAADCLDRLADSLVEGRKFEGLYDHRLFAVAVGLTGKGSFAVGDCDAADFGFAACT